MANPLFLLLLTILCISHPSSQMILLPLTHSLSHTQLNSTHHLLKSTSTRSAARFRHQRQLSLPLSPGSDYTLSFNFGSNSQPITLYMDTGSDVVWFPCTPFQCILCEGEGPSSPANITRNVAVSCKSPACSAAHNSISSSDLCAMARCPLESIETSDCASFSCPPFYYAYGDGSLIGSLYRDTLSLSSSLLLENFTFACAHTTLAEPTGVAGFGRGLLSFPAQLATLAPHLGNRFSYCLLSHSFQSRRVRRPSPLILGRYEEERVGGGEVDEFVYTPMLDNPKHPYFYCVGLVGISVGKTTIPAPEMLRRVNRRGDGGVVVDSGTTFTMLPAGFYDSVVAEFDRRVGRVHERARGVEEKTGLGPCYYLDAVAIVPSVTLRFAGGNSSVVLPSKNYFYEFFDSDDKRRVGCLMVMNGGDEGEFSGGPGAILGNYQQQGFEVVYDLEKNRIGFARRHCASLWDRLNHHKN